MQESSTFLKTREPSQGTLGFSRPFFVFVAFNDDNDQMISLRFPFIFVSFIAFSCSVVTVRCSRLISYWKISPFYCAMQVPSSNRGHELGP